MKNVLIVIALVFSFSSFAETVARVLDVQGNAFAFNGKKTTSLKYGSKVLDLTEIMVEDGATLSLLNPQGHVVHINGGSLVKLYNGIFELKNGHVWVNSTTNTSGLFNTANSIGQYGEGQFILSFDNITGKTQLLVLVGDVKFSNALEPSLNTNVSAGLFSLVDPKYENGLPRTPTKVGLSSYKQMKLVFTNFKEIQKTNFEKTMWGEEKSSPKRSIASVISAPSKNWKSKTRGRLIKITTYGGSRVPASVGPMDYYTDMKKRNAWKYKPIKNSHFAPVKYYGVKPAVKMKKQHAPMVKVVKKMEVKKTVNRVPASIQKSQMIHEIKRSGFEASLNKESKKIKRHSNEINNLIDELKTYKQDFQKDH